MNPQWIADNLGNPAHTRGRTPTPTEMRDHDAIWAMLCTPTFANATMRTLTDLRARTVEAMETTEKRDGVIRYLDMVDRRIGIVRAAAIDNQAVDITVLMDACGVAPDLLPDNVWEAFLLTKDKLAKLGWDTTRWDD